MKTKKEIKKMIDELIEKSFPTLSGKKISISFFKKGDYSGGVFWALPFWRMLFINENKIFDEGELIGLLVHELCHFETFEKRGWLKTNILGTYYFISEKFRKKEELQTDKKVIEKGYANQIYKQRLLSWKSTDENHKLKKIYMSPEEIKKYAEEIGK